jgi:hypothetical protein
MTRKIAAALGLGLLFGGISVTASQAHEVFVYAEVYDEFCPDTYCGQRAYPDPYLPDGFRKSSGYKGEDYYLRNSWYKRRLARPEVVKVYVEHRHPHPHRERRHLITK